jgi:acetyl esterase/lipase
MKRLLAVTLFVLCAAVQAAPLAQDWSNLPENKRKEYEYSLAMREKGIAKLPKDAVVKLDLPYIPDALLKGSVPGSSQTLDLYVPPGTGPFPLIVWIHGGAWKGGNKEQQGADLAARWLPEGFAVASLNYRFVWDAQFPGMFQDCIDAVAWLREHVAEYQLNPDKVGVMGASAGGHIAGVVANATGSKAYRNNQNPVQAAVLLCGFYDMTRATGQWKQGGMIDNPRDDFTNLYANRAYDEQIARDMSPVYLINGGTPPTLLVHGDKDINTAPMVQTQMFYDALQKAGKPVELMTCPDYDHNLWKPDVLAAALNFFKAKLNSKP